MSRPSNRVRAWGAAAAVVALLAVGARIVQVNGESDRVGAAGGTVRPAGCSAAGAAAAAPASSAGSAAGNATDDSTTAVEPPVALEGSPPAAASQPAAGSLPAVGENGLWPASQWERLFQRNWASESRDAQRLATSPDSWDHYTLSYSVDALTAMYRATSQRTYLEQALSLTESVAATAQPSSSLPGSQYHDTYLGWASQQEGGTEVPLYESYFWRYGTTVLRVIHDTPDLLSDPGIAARYDRLLTFVQRNVFDKWSARGADNTIFRSRTHMASHWALIALNLAQVAPDATQRAQYSRVTTAVDDDLPNYDSSLHQQMVTTPEGAYFWSDQWGKCRPPGQDVAHGNGVVAYVVESHDTGGSWTDADVAHLVTTLTTVIWPQPGRGAAFVDGSGTGTGWFSDGFVKLGRYNADLQRRLQSHQPANAQYYANGALNATLLSASR